MLAGCQNMFDSTPLSWAYHAQRKSKVSFPRFNLLHWMITEVPKCQETWMGRHGNQVRIRFWDCNIYQQDFCLFLASTSRRLMAWKCFNFQGSFLWTDSAVVCWWYGWEWVVSHPPPGLSQRLPLLRETCAVIQIAFRVLLCPVNDTQRVLPLSTQIRNVCF